MLFFDSVPIDVAEFVEKYIVVEHNIVVQEYLHDAHAAHVEDDVPLVKITPIMPSARLSSIIFILVVVEMCFESVSIVLNTTRVDALLFHPLCSFLLGDILFSIPKEGYAAVGGEYIRIGSAELNAGDSTETLTGYRSIYNLVTVEIPIVNVVLIQNIHLLFIAILEILDNISVIDSIPFQDAYLIADSIAAAQDNITSTINKFPFFFGQFIPLFILANDDALVIIALTKMCDVRHEGLVTTIVESTASTDVECYDCLHIVVAELCCCRQLLMVSGCDF